MSDYFVKKNTKEFGPMPVGEVLYMVVEENEGRVRMCYVNAKGAFAARNEARKVIPELVDSRCLFFPNPVQYGKFSNE